MKNNRGITLVSLISYVILAIMILSVLIILTTNFKKNFNELDVQAVQDVELDKINMQISKEIKDGKRLDESNFSSTKITFIDGNTYEFILADKTLYMNNNIVVAEHLENCKFELINNNILKVTAQVGNKIRENEYPLNINYVARIDRTYYRTLQSAIDAVPTNNAETTITILTDISENVSIEKSQNIVLDIGIYTIKNKDNNSVITTSGKLKIQNGTITSDATSDFETISNCEGAQLIITGGTLSSENSNVIKNSGTVEISGTANIVGNSDEKATLYNLTGGTVTITGGTISSTNSYAIYNSGTATVSGATINGSTYGI